MYWNGVAIDGTLITPRLLQTAVHGKQVPTIYVYNVVALGMIALGFAVLGFVLGTMRLTITNAVVFGLSIILFSLELLNPLSSSPSPFAVR